MMNKTMMIIFFCIISVQSVCMNACEKYESSDEEVGAFSITAGPEIKDRRERDNLTFDPLTEIKLKIGREGYTSLTENERKILWFANVAFVSSRVSLVTEAYKQYK